MQNGGTVKLTQGLTFDPNVYLYSIELSSEVVLDLNGQTLDFGPPSKSQKTPRLQFWTVRTAVQS